MEKKQEEESRFKKILRENSAEIAVILIMSLPIIAIGVAFNIESKRKYRFLEKALEKGVVRFIQ